MKKMISLRVNDDNNLILLCAFNYDNKVLHLNFDVTTRSTDLLDAILLMFNGGYTDVLCSVPVGYDVGNIPFICNETGIILHDYTVVADSDNADDQQSSCTDNGGVYVVGDLNTDDVHGYVEDHVNEEKSLNEELKEEVIGYLHGMYDVLDCRLDKLNFIDKILYDDHIVLRVCRDLDLVDDYSVTNVILSARDEFVDNVADDVGWRCD